MSGWLRVADAPTRRRLFRHGSTLPLFRRDWVSPPASKLNGRSRSLTYLYRREMRVRVSDVFGPVKRFFGW